MRFDHSPKASDSGRLEPLPSAFMRLKHRRLIQPEPDPDRHREQDGREQERNAPAPVGEGRFALAGADAEHEQQRHEQAERRRGLNPRGVQPALVLRRVLGDVDRRATVFTAEREALRQT